MVFHNCHLEVLVFEKKCLHAPTVKNPLIVFVLKKNLYEVEISLDFFAHDNFALSKLKFS